MPIHTLLIALGIAAGAIACGSGRPSADASQPADTSWVVSTKAFGPLQIGMTRAQAEAVVDASLAISGDSDWKNCGYLRSDHLPAGTRVMVEGGTIVRIDVDSGTVATADGAKIGDSEDHIRRLYPTIASTPQKYTPRHD